METQSYPVQENTNASTWSLRRVGLRVQDMERSVGYYTRHGLAIVRDLAEAYGGGITLGTSVEGGLAALLSLPRQI